MTDDESRLSVRQTSISACPEPLDKWYCLNGATCFQVKIYDAILYNCWCPSGYQGLRCDYKYVEKRDHQTPSFYDKTLIASGALNRNTGPGMYDISFALTRYSSDLTHSNGISVRTGLHNQTQHESLTSRQSTKQNYIIAFNLLMLSLLLLAFALFLIWWVLIWNDSKLRRDITHTNLCFKT